jgi:hypothetical protein
VIAGRERPGASSFPSSGEGEAPAQPRRRAWLGGSLALPEGEEETALSITPDINYSHSWTWMKQKGSKKRELWDAADDSRGKGPRSGRGGML